MKRGGVFRKRPLPAAEVGGVKRGAGTVDRGATARRRRPSGGLARLKAKTLPMRKSQAAAEQDLARWALHKRWDVVQSAYIDGRPVAGSETTPPKRETKGAKSETKGAKSETVAVAEDQGGSACAARIERQKVRTQT
ncbi:MAG: hypothetical protein ABSG68_26940 [Thermoguttaceae bacterium]|jgi:hypothetical protein